MKRTILAPLLVIVTALALVQPASAGPTSVVEDPVGDAFIWPGARPGEPFQDIVRAEVSERGGTFRFVMRLAEAIPESPTSPPWALLVWQWDLDTDPNTFPTGFPYPYPFGYGEEYQVFFVWDGTSFSAFVIDRTPLLTGGDAEIRPASFVVKGSELRVYVNAADVGDPSGFGWGAYTGDWMTKLGGAYAFVDGTSLSTWPR